MTGTAFQTHSRKLKEGAETMLEVAHQPTQEDRIQRIRQLANEKFRHEPDWVTFYREVLGVDGIINQLFPDREQNLKFQQTDEYAEIQKMLAKLREKNRGQKQPDEATRVITVRLPKSLHESLRHEAHNHKTSMNKLCISKLLQVIAGELVPSDFERSDDGDEQPQPAPVMHPQPAIQSVPVLRPATPPAMATPLPAFASSVATPQGTFTPLPAIGRGF